MTDEENAARVAEAAALSAEIDADEIGATRVIGKLLANSKKVEEALRKAGQHMEADQLRTLRIGYSTSRAMCKLLARDLHQLREAQK